MGSAARDRRDDAHQRRRTAGQRLQRRACTSRLPTDRWPLFVGGPRLGPAVLYWGVMLVVIGVALVLVAHPGLAAHDARRRAARLRHESVQPAEHRAGRRMAADPAGAAALRRAPAARDAATSFQIVQIADRAAVDRRADRARGKRAAWVCSATPEMQIVGNNSSRVRLSLVPGSGGEAAAHGIRPLAADVGLSRRDAGVVAVARVRGRALGAVGLDRVSRAGGIWKRDSRTAAADLAVQCQTLALRTARRIGTE